MDETFVGDDIAIRRITEYLHQLSIVIRHMKVILLDIKKKCSPEVFYHQIRPWLRGEDSQGGRKWIFEGIDQDPSLAEPVELLGSSAGQSSIFQALDIFFGVDHYSSPEELIGLGQGSLLKRMRLYMPRHHRNFLTHLENNPRPLRQLVTSISSGVSDSDQALLKTYNDAVLSLKELRSSHMNIVALFIIGPACHDRLISTSDSDHVSSSRDEELLLKGTGGTGMVRFLKGIRDRTGHMLIDSTQ
jgi:indoleamine 2,3-dioxygenase